jgi:hypothetical protein
MMDVDINKPFKDHCCLFYDSWYEDGNGCLPHRHNAVTWCDIAWNTTGAKTIVKTWEHIGYYKNSTTVVTDQVKCAMCKEHNNKTLVIFTCY